LGLDRAAGKNTDHELLEFAACSESKVGFGNLCRWRIVDGNSHACHPYPAAGITFMS
jgi:hypothetical protein